MAEGPIFNDQALLLVMAHPQHTNAVGLAWIQGIGLLQQQGTGGQLGCGAEHHLDGGKEGWIGHRLCFIGKDAAELLQQTAGDQGHGRTSSTGHRGGGRQTVEGQPGP